MLLIVIGLVLIGILICLPIATIGFDMAVSSFHKQMSVSYVSKTCGPIE